MDLATIIGIVAAFGFIIYGVWLGGSFSIFYDFASIVLVFGGGFAVTIMRFPLSSILTAFAMGGSIAFTHKKVSPKDMIDEICGLAEIVRKNGPLGLENAEIKQTLLKKGAQMVADGYDIELIKTMMEREKDLFLERIDSSAKIYKALGDAGPAFGMIGTLVGLVQMLANMSDPSTIGPAMAVALLTTLYGSVLANVVCLPIFDKLNIKISIEEINQSLAIDGILQLRENKSPQIIKESLIAYLPEKERIKILAEMNAA